MVDIEVPSELFVPDSLAELEEFMRFTLGVCTPHRRGWWQRGEGDVCVMVAPITLDRLPVSPTDVVSGVATFKVEHAATVDHCRLWRGGTEVGMGNGKLTPAPIRVFPGDKLIITLVLTGMPIG